MSSYQDIFREKEQRENFLRIRDEVIEKKIGGFAFLERAKELSKYESAATSKDVWPLIRYIHAKNLARGMSSSGKLMCSKLAYKEWCSFEDQQILLELATRETFGWGDSMRRNISTSQCYWGCVGKVGGLEILRQALVFRPEPFPSEIFECVCLALKLMAVRLKKQDVKNAIIMAKILGGEDHRWLLGYLERYEIKDLDKKAFEFSASLRFFSDELCSKMQTNVTSKISEQLGQAPDLGRMRFLLGIPKPLLAWSEKLESIANKEMATQWSYFKNQYIAYWESMFDGGQFYSKNSTGLIARKILDNIHLPNLSIAKNIQPSLLSHPQKHGGLEKALSTFVSEITRWCESQIQSLNPSTQISEYSKDVFFDEILYYERLMIGMPDWRNNVVHNYSKIPGKEQLVDKKEIEEAQTLYNCIP